MEREDILEQLNAKILRDSSGTVSAHITSKDQLLQEAREHGLWDGSSAQMTSEQYAQLRLIVEQLLLLDSFLWQSILESHSLSFSNGHAPLLADPLLGYSIYYILNKYTDLLTQSDGWRFHNLISEGMISIMMEDSHADITFFETLKESVMELIEQMGRLKQASFVKEMR